MAFENALKPPGNDPVYISAGKTASQGVQEGKTMDNIAK